MVGDLQKVGHLVIARRAGGEPVELVRSPEEVVFLSFDDRIKRLVEVHVLRSGNSLGSVAKREAFDRAREATAVRSSAFMRILDVGEDKGLVYYTTNLNDGEFVTDYVARRGPFPQAMGLCMVLQLLDDLIQLQEHRWLVAQMRLDRVVVSTLEDAFLQLRVYDYGLSAREPEEGGGGEGRLVGRACELIFLLLTGKVYDGDNPDRFPALSGLPMNLRITLRVALTDPAQSAASLENLRDNVREAYGALVSSIQGRNPRKQLVVTPAVQPRSQLQDLLLENTPVESILGTRFRVEDAEQVRRHPFSIPCINVKTDQPVTVHLLPPSRIVDRQQYDAVPLQTWRFDAERHPNILRSLSLWESPDWSFLTEEREPGFTVSRLMAERMFLNPAEVLVVMRQVRAGMEQALECGVQRVDLHPSNIVLRVGKAGPLLNREYERLMQKRLDAWPHFQVKLRAHLTMRNLCEPLLVDPPQEGEHAEVHLADRDYRHRAFVMLAAYLLTGDRYAAARGRFPEALPEGLANLIKEMLEATRQAGLTPSPAEFLERFEAAANGPVVPDLAARLRGAEVPLEEMESAGSVSDFDEDWPAEINEPEDEWAGPVARTIKVTQLNQRPRSRAATVGPVWAAAAAVVLAMGSWWYFSNEAMMTAPAMAGQGSGVPGLMTGSPEAEAAPTEPEAAAEAPAHPEIPRPANAKPVMVKKSDAPAPGTGMALPPVFAEMRTQEAATRPPVPVMAKVFKEEIPDEGERQPNKAPAPEPKTAAEVLAKNAGALTQVGVETNAALQKNAGAPPIFVGPPPPPVQRTIEAMAPPVLTLADLPPAPKLETAATVVERMPEEVKVAQPAESRISAPPEPPPVIRRALVPSEEELAKLRRAEVGGAKSKPPESVKGQLSRR